MNSTIRIPSVVVLQVEPQPLNQKTLSLAGFEGGSLKEWLKDPLAAFATIGTENDHEDEHEQESPRSFVLNSGQSLYDAVVENANHRVYDAKIGRYVSASTTQGHDVFTDTKYANQMVKSKIELTRVVNEVRTRQMMGLWDSTDRMQKSTSALTVACSLCEQEFPRSQLVGRISFKAVCRWREEHHAPIDPTDRRLAWNRVHEPSPVCIFCNQFFDEDFGDVVEPAAVISSSFEGLDIRVDEMEASSKQLKKIINVYKPQVEDRPLSAMKHKMALSRLKLRAEINSSAQRIQYNNRTATLLDQEKAGRLLRNKYSSVSATSLVPLHPV